MLHCHSGSTHVILNHFVELFILQLWGRKAFGTHSHLNCYMENFRTQACKPLQCGLVRLLACFTGNQAIVIIFSFSCARRQWMPNVLASTTESDRSIHQSTTRFCTCACQTPFAYADLTKYCDPVFLNQTYVKAMTRHYLLLECGFGSMATLLVATSCPHSM